MKIETYNPFNIEGKVIAIIGATGLLGKRYVDYLSSHGAIIIIGDINYSQCNRISSELNKKGRKTFPLRIDITNEESIINFFIKIKQQFDGLNVLINNVQVKPKGFYSPFEKYKKNTLIKVIDGNLIGATLTCREACNIFVNSGGGVIVNVASIYGIVAPDQRIYNDVSNIYSSNEKFSSPVSYAISKAGIIQLTKYLASYYREKNIRVNCLTPGGVFDGHDEVFMKQYSIRTLIGRMADKDEYNAAILFLCSDASSYMTGANLIIDGGWSVI